MRNPLRAGVNHGRLYRVPEVWLHAGIARVGSGRGQNGVSTVPFVSAARLRDQSSWLSRCLDAAVRVMTVFSYGCYILSNTISLATYNVSFSCTDKKLSYR